MTRTVGLKKWMHLGSQLLVALAFIVGVIVLLLWLAGKFSAKVPDTPPTTAAESVAIEKTVPVRLMSLPVYESAVGSVQAVHETTIGSKLLASVTEINATGGQKVKAGEVLVRLDDKDLKAKLQQAQAAVAAIEANLVQAESDVKRYASLLPSKAISRQVYEQAVAKAKAIEADLRRAKASRDEAQTALDWATIRSPINGIVFDKAVDVGDMVSPGQILVTLYDPQRMQLVSNVRESLIHQLREGQDIGVKIKTLDKMCTGTVSEIVPQVRADSRSFQVKVTGPCPPGIYSGMFGRILIPMGEEKVLVIPKCAVQSVGQLKQVYVEQDGKVKRRPIRTGRTFGQDIEVLSGLREGEKVIVLSSSGSPTGTPSRGASCPIPQEASHD